MQSEALFTQDVSRTLRRYCQWNPTFSSSHWDYTLFHLMYNVQYRPLEEYENGVYFGFAPIYYFSASQFTEQREIVCRWKLQEISSSYCWPSAIPTEKTFYAYGGKNNKSTFEMSCVFLRWVFISQYHIIVFHPNTYVSLLYRLPTPALVETIFYLFSIVSCGIYRYKQLLHSACFRLLHFNSIMSLELWNWSSNIL